MLATSGGTEERSAADQVFDRISVRPPYFALDQFEELAPGLVRATVPGAAPVFPEAGAVAAAQVALHLAILGSCAAALSRDDNKRHHYLAVEAPYTWAASRVLKFF
ncbi:MAG: hypothetical protein ACI8Y4_003877 [Candidatus Poriferisodalaceae bacterium]|jgi:hypothetical protein